MAAAERVAQAAAVTAERVAQAAAVTAEAVARAAATGSVQSSALRFVSSVP